MALKVTAAALMLVLLASILSPLVLPGFTVAAPDENRWSRVNIPTEGSAGNWVLAAGSDVQHLTAAIDGTLFCYANPSGTSYTLFKSRDGVYTWSYTGGVTDIIVDIATAPDSTSIVYYATKANVYRSADGGSSFAALPAKPGGAGDNNTEIMSLAIARLGNSRIVAVGTRDTDSSQYGGVYTLDENEPTPIWQDTALVGYDIFALSFSPNYTIDHQLVAVGTDEKDTVIISRIGNAEWGKTIGNATIKGIIAKAATLAFPNDYNAVTEGHTFFVALDTGTNLGDVYKVNGIWAPGNSVATDLNIGSGYGLSNIDISGIVAGGNAASATLLAGTANSAHVYISSDSGQHWTSSRKEPTGQSKTSLLMIPGATQIFAGTCGTESAFSLSRDNGATWNQISLIDTRIESSAILDLAVSPNYSQDNTLFMLTWGGEHSLWRSSKGGLTWERVFSGALPDVDTLGLVKLSTQYGRSGQVVYLSGTSGGNPTLWKSADNGQNFTQRSVPFSIDTWVVVNNDSLFLGSYDGTNGLVYRTTDGGASYSTGVIAGNQPLKSIVLSPDYERDGAMLVGNTSGWVYLSTNYGVSFARLGQQLPLSNYSLGQVSTVFDTRYASNHAVYAISDAQVTSENNECIFRFFIGQSTMWESIDNTVPSGSMLSQLVIAANGTLYAGNSQPVSATRKEGGMERSLNPSSPADQTFETVVQGLDEGAILTGLWLQGDQLWSIDTRNTQLMTYMDSLSQPVSLISPTDKISGIDNNAVTLVWTAMNGATRYQWQIDYDTDFLDLPDGFEGYCEVNSVQLSKLKTGITYYWRVRASRPGLSQWSTIWSFTTVLDITTITPELKTPEAGASGVSTKPIFQWNAVVEATKYELLVSKDASFSNPAIMKIGDYAINTTRWVSTTNLSYNTTYSWKVRAVSRGRYSLWSTVRTFTTEIAPSQLPPATGPSSDVTEPSPPVITEPTILVSTSEPPPYPPPAQSVTIDWIPLVIALMGLTIIILFVVIFMLLRKRQV
jgi:hypothetical protein